MYPLLYFCMLIRITMGWINLFTYSSQLKNLLCDYPICKFYKLILQHYCEIKNKKILKKSVHIILTAIKILFHESN